MLETPPPRPTDKRFFDAYLEALPAPPSERWPVFAARDDLPATEYAFAASALYSSHLDEDEVAEVIGPDGVYVPIEGQTKTREELDALSEAYRFASQHRLTEHNLLRAHRIIGAPFLPDRFCGAYRTGPMAVRNAEGGIVYVAVEPQHVEGVMDTFLDDLARLTDADLTVDEVFYHASLLHAVFLHIHPFANGNGRVARLLEKWFVAEHLGEKAWTVPSEKHAFLSLNLYNSGLDRGVNYYFLYYDPGLKDADGIVPFLTLLPGALDDEAALARDTDG